MVLLLIVLACFVSRNDKNLFILKLYIKQTIVQLKDCKPEHRVFFLTLNQDFK